MSLEGPKVECPFCKAVVGVGRLHCPSCGENMATTAGPPKAIRQREPGTRHPLVSVLRGLITVLLLLVIVMMFWPKVSPGELGTSADARMYRDKINWAERAMKKKEYNKTMLEEMEVNAHLARIVRDQPVSDSSIPVRVDEISIDAKKDTIIAYLNQKVWVIHLTYQFEMKPGVDDQGFAPEVLSAHLGHLPMVSVLKYFVVNRFEKTLANLSQEKKILGRVSRVAVTDGKVGFEIK